MEDTPLVGIVFLWMIWSGGGFVVRCSCCSMPPSLIPQTLDAIVDMVDKMVVFIVRAAAGCPEFSSGPKSRLMVSVVMLVRFLLLVGGGSMLPREYALARFGRVDYREDAEEGAHWPSSGGRALRIKWCVGWSHCWAGVFDVCSRLRGRVQCDTIQQCLSWFVWIRRRIIGSSAMCGGRCLAWSQRWL